MPCYSRITSTVEFSESTDVKLLANAMKALGYTVTTVGKGLAFAKYDENGPITGTYREGSLTVQGSIDEKLLKRTYSAEVVKSAAARFGWQVKQASPNTFQVTRRA